MFPVNLYINIRDVHKHIQKYIVMILVELANLLEYLVHAGQVLRLIIKQ